MSQSKCKQIKTQPEVTRCSWLTKDPLYINYHDIEWGKPELDCYRLFEMLCLEGQQAGLSWVTVLKKRENYRHSFYNFDPIKISKMNGNDLSNLLNYDSGVIRHKAKLEAIINNASCYLKMENSGEDFTNFVWSFVGHSPIVNEWKNITDIPAVTEKSKALSNALKKKGFKFVGPKICYAFMQACGLVNDHVVSCFCRN